MSQLQLSAQLVTEIQQLLQQHDEAASDPGVASQYLCALVGFLLGQQDMPAADKDEIRDELHAFTRHVLKDVEGQRQAARTPPQQQAFGIWKPGMS